MQISSRYVKDEGPEDAKIVLIGEAPGEVEDKEGRPFVGEAGAMLTSVLLRNGIQREEVRLANLFHFRPARNDFTQLVGTPELSASVNELNAYLERTKPSVVVPLGRYPLHYIAGKEGILNYRGSVLEHPSIKQLKIIPTVHPSYVNRFREWYPVFDMDIKRIVEDSRTPDLNIPTRQLIIANDDVSVERYTQELMSATKLAVDIETFGNQLACVGFADSANRGICFVWNNHSVTRDCITRLLESDIPKIFHFGTFDVGYLHLLGFRVNNYFWDTMVAQHVMWVELPRSLAFLTSTYTRQPYYKQEGKEAFDDIKRWGAKASLPKLWEYNCKDVCVTYEIQEKQATEIKDGPPEWQRVFSFEMEQLEPAFAISNNGMLVDTERHALLRSAVIKKLELMQVAFNHMCGGECNVGSPKQIKSLLYEGLGLPKKYGKPKPGKEASLTTDEDALVALITFAKGRLDEVKRASTKSEWQLRVMILKAIIVLRGLRKMKSSYLDFDMSSDGRVRSTYKVPATDSGRWSAELFVDGTGLNAQTFPREGVEIDEATS